MAAVVRVGDPPIDVTLRRNARARRLTLRVSRDGPVLTLPTHASMRSATSFLTAQEGWLRSRLADLPETVRISPGAVIPIFGEPVELVASEGRRIKRSGDCLEIPGPPASWPGRVAGYLKTIARGRLVPMSETYAKEIDRKVARVTLRDPKSRWGSCSERGALMYSWRLALAPIEIQDYVAAHEVAHLKEFNHSRYFWRIVQDLCPDYAEHRAWLRAKGPELHAIRFEP